MQWFLKINVIKNKITNKLRLNQNFYIDKLITKFNLILNHTAKTTQIFLSYEILQKHQNQTSFQKIHAYQQRVEFINFAAIIIRIDVAFAIFKFSKFFINFFSFHMKCVNRIIRYFVAKKLNIEFNFDFNAINQMFVINSNVLFVDDFDIKHNSQNYAFKFFNDLINWKIFKQKTIIINSIEVELLILSTTIKKYIWWNRFFEKINLMLNFKTFIQCDNFMTIKIFITNRLIIKFKHVNIHKHWLRQKISNDQIAITWMFNTIIFVDEFTKSLITQRHKKFIKLLNLIDSVVRFENVFMNHFKKKYVDLNKLSLMRHENTKEIKWLTQKPLIMIIEMLLINKKTWSNFPSIKLRSFSFSIYTFCKNSLVHVANIHSFFPSQFVPHSADS